MLLLGLARLQGRQLVPPRDAWPGILIAGLLAIAVFNLCTAWAQLATTTSRAAVLTFTMPIMSAALARPILGERLDTRKRTALVLGVLGIAVLAWPVARHILQTGDPRAIRGLAFPLTAAFGWAAGTIYLKRWPVRGDRIVITAWQLVVGAACGLAGALIIGEHWPAHPPTPRALAALGFHIVFGTAVAYWLWFILIERVSATVSSLTTLMVPVVGVLSAMLLVGDRPEFSDWIGFALVLAGALQVVLRVGSRRG